MNAIQKNNKEKRNQLMFDFLNKKKSLKEAYSINSQPIIGVVTFEDYEMAAVYPRKGEQYLKRIFIKGGEVWMSSQKYAPFFIGEGMNLAAAVENYNRKHRHNRGIIGFKEYH